MFEKEAEEYTVEHHCKNCWMKDADGDSKCTGLDHCSCHKDWQKGAEFGYNKANEWNYVSEKGAPKITGNYHIWLGKCNYVVTYYDGIRFWVLSEDPESGWIDVNDVIAWKEIILPKRMVNSNDRNS